MRKSVTVKKCHNSPPFLIPYAKSVTVASISYPVCEKCHSLPPFLIPYVAPKKSVTVFEPYVTTQKVSQFFYRALQCHSGVPITPRSAQAQARSRARRSRGAVGAR